MAVDLPVMRFFECQLCAGHWLQKGGQNWGEIGAEPCSFSRGQEERGALGTENSRWKGTEADCRVVLGTSFYKVAVKKIRWQVGTCNVPALGIGIASEGQQS